MAQRRPNDHRVIASRWWDAEDWTFQSSVSKTTLEVDLPALVSACSKVWFTAFWYNPRAQSGPAATPVSTVVQYGGMAKAA